VLIIPELETVVILVPRTGSGSLKNAVLARYPKAFSPYRHMEADGVPHGYDRWRRIGVVRHPVERLWSLYKFLRDFGGRYEPAYIAAMRASVGRPFSDWVLNNQVVFSNPYDSAGEGRFWPQYAVLHSLPENRKSQFVYLRPDLGTEVRQFSEVTSLAADLGVALPSINVTKPDPVPDLSPEATHFVARCFRWDFAATKTATALAAE
jgi:hypothetical protein